MAIILCKERRKLVSNSRNGLQCVIKVVQFLGRVSTAAQIRDRLSASDVGETFFHNLSLILGDMKNGSSQNLKFFTPCMKHADVSHGTGTSTI